MRKISFDILIVFLLSAVCESLPAQPTDRAPATSTQPANGTPAPALPDVTDEELEGMGGIEDLELLEMEVPEVTIVTASRHEQKISEVPYAVSVITAEDIRWSGARNIADALRLAAGVDVAELSYGSAAFSPRGNHGLLANQILVLIDGRQFFNPIMAGTFTGSQPLILEDIKQIEVIRGPGGVTWGGNAAQGVINIITKDPRDQEGLTLHGSGGSRDTYKSYTGYGFADEKLSLRVSAEYETSDGFYDPRPIFRTLESEYRCQRYSFRSVYQQSPRDRLTLSGGSGLMQDGFSPSPINGFGLDVQPHLRSSYLMGAWHHEKEPDNSFELRGYISEAYERMGIKQFESQFQQIGLLFNHQFELAKDHTFTWGIDNRVDFVDASLADPFLLSDDHLVNNNIGLFARHEWRFAPQWTFNLGGRIEYDNYGGFEPSAHGALSYQLNDNTLLFGAVSRSYAMPPVGTRFMNAPMVNGITRFTAPQDIEAMSLLAYELGWRGHYFDERLKWNLNFFWHEMADLITIHTALGPPGIFQARMDNRGDASIYGIEMENEFKVTRKLTLLNNYTFQMLNWRGTAFFNETDFMSPPKHKFMLGARYKMTEDLRLSSHLYYVDASKAPNPRFPFVPMGIDPYCRLDLRAEQELWEDKARFAVGVRNLLDKSHFEGASAFLDEAEVPRMIYAEFRIVFNKD